MTYPIETLNYSITKLLSGLPIVQETVKKGLMAEILLKETNQGHRVLSEIDPTGQVFLAPSFCQFIWNISYAAIVYTDFNRIIEELKKCGIGFDLFRNLINTYDLKANKNKISADEFQSMEFLKSALSAQPWEKMILIGYNSYAQKLSDTDQLTLSNLDMNSAFSQRINGVYNGAISFVLLHELFHFERKHFRNGIQRIDMEKEADNYAFDTILASFSGKEKKTYVIGAICTLCSFFFMNPLFSNSGNYPYEDERLFTQYDKLQSPEKELCKSIIINVLSIWALCFSITSFPIITNNEDTDISNIRNFLSTYNKVI